MPKATPLGPRAYLKATGFLLDNKPRRIDVALLKSLDPSSRSQLEEIWTFRNMGLSDGLDAYKVPQTAAQAALLFSHDWPRAAATINWFAELVGLVSPSSIVEMGCGAGFLLGYLRAAYPGIKLQGIDSAPNLASIASGLTDRPIIAGDYRSLRPDDAYDFVVCDFGFDLARYAQSTRPHTLTRIGAQEFCVNCSDDMAEEFTADIRAWRMWASPKAPLALAGRIGGFGLLRALMVAARSVDWEISLKDSKILTVRNIVGDVERFPAILFSPRSSLGGETSFEAAARFFGS